MFNPKLSGCQGDVFPKAFSLDSGNSQRQRNNSSESSALQSGDSVSNLTPLTQICIYHELVDVSASSNSTQYTYRKGDGSLAMRVKSSTDIHLKQETIAIDLDFSAEMLGLDHKDFLETGGEPIQFQLSFRQTNIQYSHYYSEKTVHTLRKTHEVLRDVASAIGKIMRGRGDKKYAVLFDSEAIQSLLQDDASRELLVTVMGLLAMIQMLQNSKQADEQEIIHISGKGQPYQDIEEKTSLTGEQINFELNITVHPPQNSAAQITSSSETQAVVPEQNTSTVDVVT